MLIPNIEQGSFTRGEILQQPDLWPETLEQVRHHPVIDLVKGRAPLVCGAGTSAYAAAAIATAWPGARTVPTTDLLLYSPDELLRGVPEFPERGVVISIARSGDSPESTGVVTRLQKMFPAVPHVAITCSATGALAKTAGVQNVILDPRTNDRSLAMTSSFTNLTLAGLALFHAEILSEQMQRIVDRTRVSIGGLNAIAEKLAGARLARVVVLAGPDLKPLATEACLKILEMTGGRTTAIPETFLGLRHGPMSFLREDSLIVGFLSSDAHKRRYEEDLLMELGQKNLGVVVAVTESELPQDMCRFSAPANAPELPDYLRTPFEAVFPQLLAYHLSLAFGLDPDNPSPEGVITRVVQKFRMHEEIG